MSLTEASTKRQRSTVWGKNYWNWVGYWKVADVVKMDSSIYIEFLKINFQPWLKKKTLPFKQKWHLCSSYWHPNCWILSKIRVQNEKITNLYSGQNGQWILTILKIFRATWGWQTRSKLNLRSNISFLWGCQPWRNSEWILGFL